MKPALTMFILLLLLTACENSNKPAIVKSAQASQDNNKAKSKGLAIPVVKYGIEGFYTGVFLATQYDDGKEYYNNRITLCIDSLNETTIFGHSVVAGNSRFFSGNYIKENGKYIATVKEPGDNKYDGTFIFELDPEEKILEGDWKAFSKDIVVTNRHYELNQQSFIYDPALELPEDIAGAHISGTYNEDNSRVETVTEDVLKLNASKTILTAKDVENLYKTDLEVLRNAIYARHGYSFKNIRMRDLFDNYVAWYMPVSLNVTGQLTEIEKKNIELIKRYEAHATKYYDVFGR